MIVNHIGFVCSESVKVIQVDHLLQMVFGNESVLIILIIIIIIISWCGESGVEYIEC